MSGTMRSLPGRTSRARHAFATLLLSSLLNTGLAHAEEGPTPGATADVIVVGAGPGGLATALELVHRGFKNVVVLEKYIEEKAATREQGVWLLRDVEARLAELGVDFADRERFRPIEGVEVKAPSAFAR